MTIWSPAVYVAVLLFGFMIQYEPVMIQSGYFSYQPGLFQYLIGLPMAFVFLGLVLVQQQKMIEGLRDELRRLRGAGKSEISD